MMQPQMKTKGTVKAPHMRMSKNKKNTRTYNGNMIQKTTNT